MKDLKSVMASMKSTIAANAEANQQKELIKQQVSENAKKVIDDLFVELKSCYPAWKQAFESRETWIAAKQTWTKAFIENGISNESQVSIGLAEARKGTNPFWPSVGQFISWCKGPSIDTELAFDRMIRKEPTQGIAEYTTRQEVGFRCKTQLAEDKARQLFGKTLVKNIGRVERGELVEPEKKDVQIDTPQNMRKAETPEQRNNRMDQEIKRMIANKQPLIGPYKKRHDETKGK